MGGIFKIDGGSVNLLKDYHNPKFILKNLIIFLNFLFLYNSFEISKNELKKGFNIKIFASIFIIILVLEILNIFDYLQYIELGGGVFSQVKSIAIWN